MKRKIISILIALGLVLGLTAIPSLAATPEEIEASIEKGLDCLVPQQNPNGSWGAWDTVARTAFAVIKLEDRAFEMESDPFDEEYEYSGSVTAGLNYLFSRAVAVPIGMQPAGNPDSEGDGSAIAIFDGHPTYETGAAMMAIVASRHPEMVVSVPGSVVDGWTYKRVMQNAVDYFAWGQADAPGWGRGGWWYSPNMNGADNSNSGYAVLGLRYAEAELYGFQCTIPDFVKTELSFWINYIQCRVPGPDFGGSGYTSPCDWVNCLKTGNLLFEMAFCGLTTDNQLVKNAISYIQNHWDDPGGCGTGWADPPHYQAMYCLMKGFESMGIDTITVTRNSEPVEVDWFNEISTVIVESQDDVTGCWPGDCWGDSLLATEWALLTLERVAPPPPQIQVPVDIKPTSCPNPLNVKSKGVLPVAILGTEDFDVTQVDPETVALAGVPPLRWALEDVATPYEPFIGKEGCEACTTEGPDGYMDLTFKFDTQAIVAALGDVSDGECLVLELTGNLMEEFDGTPIIGEDVVRIIKKQKGK